MKRKLIAAVGVAGMMVGLAACGNGDDDKAKADAGPKEITVWVMDGSAPKAGSTRSTRSSRPSTPV